MTTPQSAPFGPVRFTGSQTTNFAVTAAVFSEAKVVADRTGTGGLNSLPVGSSLAIFVDWSPDGVAWQEIADKTCWGGTFTVTKNGTTITVDSEELDVSIGTPFPTGTSFRLRTVASTAVRVSGTVTYD